MNKTRSQSLFEKALPLMPGGVNSPVRAFKAVGGNPLFIKKGIGPYLIDEDDNQFIELINSWGPMILGHAHPEVEAAVTSALKDSFSFGAPGSKEVTMAELITSILPSVEMVRMVNSGTEATMAAIRVARGYTKKSKIIKFEGCYHGHGDAFLIAAGSGALTMGTPDSPGVTQGIANDTLTVPYNDLTHLEETILANKDSIAAIILEPVVGNMGCVLPEPGYLQGIRKLCDDHQIVLIFDEVMTGFRLSLGGAQELYGVKPDLTTMGKIIGGGMPVGAYGGKKEIMQMVSPAGPVYQAGTLSGNPIAMTAGIAMLNLLKSKASTLYPQLDQITKKIVNGWEANAKSLGAPVSFNQVGSMFTMFFTEEKVTNFTSAKTANTKLFGQYFNNMLEEGVYLAPSQFESLFISESITEELADKIIEANYNALKKLS